MDKLNPMKNKQPVESEEIGRSTEQNEHPTAGPGGGNIRVL